MIVDKSIEDGKSLVRVLNSLVSIAYAVRFSLNSAVIHQLQQEAKYLIDMLQMADPPINVVRMMPYLFSSP